MGESTSTILCVSENAQTLERLSILLKQEGYRVITEPSKSKAISKARCCVFDLFIFDVHLADGSGIELCDEIKESHKDTPILFYTSEPGTDYITGAVKAGAKAYLSPPLYPTVLKESVARFIRESK